MIEEVERIQERILNATVGNDYNLIYKLQRQLVTSLAARALAVRRVATNSGSKTAGVDNIV